MRPEYKLLLAASLLANFGDNLIGPFYAVFVERIGGSILDIGYSITVFSVATGLLIMAVGRLSDRIDKEMVTVLGYSLYALGDLGYLFVSSVWHLFVLQVVFALGTACLAAPLSALFARFIQKGKEGAQWGLEGGGTHIVVGLAVFFGTLIVNYFGFRTLFLLMFIFQMTAVTSQVRLLIKLRGERTVLRT